MNAHAAQLNGLNHGTRPQGKGHIWPAIIIALLCMNATIVAITVYFAVSDQSSATEPDYYAKALNFNDVILQRGANARLGWTATSELRPSEDGRTVELVVRLSDADSNPVSGVSLRAVAFASIRSSQRQSITLSPGVAGEYSAPIHIDRAGVWCLSLTATRSADVFTCKSEFIVPDSPR